MTKILACLLFHCIFALVTRRFINAATQSDFLNPPRQPRGLINLHFQTALEPLNNFFVLYEDYTVQLENFQTFSLFKSVVLQPLLKKKIYVHK